MLGLNRGPLLAATEPRTIVFFGDSLTAGHGPDNPPARGSHPALIGRQIAEAGLPWRVVSAGLSGDTSAGGERRLDWVLRQPLDIFVLELGANDGLRGFDPAETTANLKAIVTRVRARFPLARIVLVGMRMPPTLGEDYTRAYAAIFPRLAAEEQLTLVPFLLAGVAGHPDLIQDDGLHPTAAGHIVLADNVWRVLRPLLTP